MKKTIVFVLTILILFSGFATQSYALSDSKSVAIQALLDDASRTSGVPGMSISILANDEVFYFSSGYADLEKGLSASENTLYELASVSKAFTGMGILLLEEQGLLSMTDPIQKYLPWFTLKYQGKPVDMQSLTLNNFLHHTSGLTNIRHTQNIPQGNTPDMLQKTVETLVDAELAFSPGEQYNYGTVNYDVLGLVIEIVSRQSYEDFMREQVFLPLGLHQTYVYKEDAQATGQLAQGYRSSFFITTPFNAPDYAGNKPAGYIISNTKDMARWMGIQMGIVQDIPEIFHRVIEKSHRGDMSVSAVNDMYYAAGWSVNAEQTFIEHTGGNPNFRTEVAILPNERTAICLLSNGANTNINLVLKVKDILDGNLTQSYEISGTQLLDIILSSTTIILCLLAVLLFLLGLRKRKTNEQQPITKKRTIVTIIFLIATIAQCIMFFAFDWSTILIWQTYSVLTALISSTLLTASITWYILTDKMPRSENKYNVK
ncbi:MULTISPECIES: serine hydrolase domain-containing protein [Lysinibacillus]|uniref:Serine hydrolase n=4 Tax=Lysinibacillus TaxID=400634 RepID=A0A2I0UZF8_9BACI|nr:MULTISPECIES: serine hydrolase domain-containing protein [Lysinibacillus]KUF32534.1 serine hydrolase [Lysinibacillus sp. F5]MEE3806514.1 serine hydrolase domain-containing protein [Lysinibacillus fusiformis]PKU51461.1 serine hydrolase [Lysinibacillus fusiformis]SCY78381.1 CubicO group peptidase, beta-lactamase class C family [Lysinibacillus sp. SG9]SDB40499.1 CubicO group peptidase, beta-lactamase class C family [Lysinibacillus sp. TC-37]